MTALPVTAENPVSTPVKAPAAIRVCPGPGCNTVVEVPLRGPGQHKQFCSPKCRSAFADREKRDGAIVISVAKIWRRKRGSGEIGKAAFQEMTAILDLLLDRDRSDGCVIPDTYAKHLLRTPYLDRQRKR